MSLDRYRAMRQFRSTPEPRGRVSRRAGGAPRFVIQRHDASHLHYDFRLEIDGVLKSWAVPKGPSLDPADKRLAVEVEDHPLDYADFEGVIPRGAYGAGTVAIVARGRWSPTGDGSPAEQLERGTLEFRLEDSAYAGPWRLVRTRRDTRKPQWLLMRRNEPSDAPPAPRRGAARPSAPSRDIAPQLATPLASPPTGGDWACELKWDGYRLIATVREGRVALASRGGLDWTGRLPNIVEALQRAKLGDAVVDGELIHGDGAVASFPALQAALAAESDEGLRFVAFDLLRHEGADLTGAAWRERRARLEAALPSRPGTVFVGPVLDGSPAEAYGWATRHGFEGILVKRPDAPYVAGRSRAWGKLKRADAEDFAVVGWTPPRGSRTGVGALLLARRGASGGWAYAGKAGSGLSAADIALIVKTAPRERQQTPTVAMPDAVARIPGATWIRPRWVAEVASRGVTASGLLRQPTVKAVRLDRSADELAGPAAAPVTLTHPRRVVDAKSGATKQDVADYYDAIAPLLLAGLAGRPASVVRSPEGVDGAAFFQKHPFAGLDASDGRRTARAADGVLLHVGDAAALARCVQLNVLEFHPWGARLDDPENADRLVFDLDPGPGVPWAEVRRAAIDLRDALAELDLRAFLRTSGGKGLHLVVPLAPPAPWADARGFAEAFARTLASREPERFVATAAKAKREGRIYIDYLRNARGATSVASYSLRARPGLPVAMPLRWEALPRLRGADAFPLAKALAHLRRRRVDPWAELPTVRQTLPAPSRRGRARR